MKDILFLYPLYYSPNGLTRFAQYLDEEPKNYSWDVFVSCSNQAIFEQAQRIADTKGFHCELRDNYGAGAGALWWLQNELGEKILDYEYVWYYEESCEPVRRGWMRRLLGDFEHGLPVSGWWWCPEGRPRKGAIAHRLKGSNGGEVVYYENTGASGCDEDGHPFDGLCDVPGYRGETFVVRSRDFLDFRYADPRDPFWINRNGVRTYGVKAERFWWDPDQVDRHGYPFPSPNIQWYVLSKYRMFPSAKNIHKGFFRELTLAIREGGDYRPYPVRVRNVLAHLTTGFGIVVQLSRRILNRFI